VTLQLDGDAPVTCVARWVDRVQLPMKALDDPEGACVPDALPPVVDAHVHLFPDRVFEAIWRWFDTHAWRSYGCLAQSDRLLLSRGVRQLVALHTRTSRGWRAASTATSPSSARPTRASSASPR